MAAVNTTLRLATRWFRQVNPKIFCIGFNKTGTTSLHNFFTGVGITATHQTQWALQSHLSSGRSYFRKWQAFSDGEQANFRKLDEWFPDAIFLQNTRDERAWLRSRIKHVLRFGLPVAVSHLELGGRFGEMARGFLPTSLRRSLRGFCIVEYMKKGFAHTLTERHVLLRFQSQIVGIGKSIFSLI